MGHKCLIRENSIIAFVTDARQGTKFFNAKAKTSNSTIHVACFLADVVTPHERWLLRRCFGLNLAFDHLPQRQATFHPAWEDDAGKMFNSFAVPHILSIVKWVSSVT